MCIPQKEPTNSKLNISTVYHSKFEMAPPNHTNTIGSMYEISALVNDIEFVLADDFVSITSGVLVLLDVSCVVRKSSSSSSFIRTFGSYSVVSREKSPDPEPLPASNSSGNGKYNLPFQFDKILENI